MISRLNGSIFKTMLTVDDKKEIREIVMEENSQIRSSLMEIEKDREVLKDIWEFVKDHTLKIGDHEERITQLESRR